MRESDSMTFGEKLLNGVDLDDEEMREMAYDGFKTTPYFRNRWTTTTQTLYKVGDRVFAIDWEKGNTEMQEDCFYNQPYEIKLVKRLVEVEDYELIGKGE